MTTSHAQSIDEANRKITFLESEVATLKEQTGALENNLSCYASYSAAVKSQSRNESYVSTSPTIAVPQRYEARAPELQMKTPGKINNKQNRSRIRRSVVRATGDVDSDLKIMEPLKHIHVWNFHPDTSEQNLLSYIDKKRPSKLYNVKKPEPSHTRHNCFIVSVPQAHFDFFMTPDNWPKGTMMQEWYAYKRKTTNRDGNRTFFRSEIPQSTEG